MALLFRLFYSKWFPPPLPSQDAFKDQTILITGATGGLGMEAAIHYMELNASRIIITARTLSRGLAAQATIESRTGKTGIIEVRELDMSTFAGVKKFVDELREDVKTIDVVLLNAGVYKMTYNLSPDEWEETLQVNTLSTISLGLLLLPWMEACRPPGRKQHLGFVSSELHTKPKIETENFPKENVFKYLSEEKHFLGPGTYALSKLFLMYGVAEIVKISQLDDGSPSPIINTMCPGLCKSDLGRQYTSSGYLWSIGVNIFLTLLGKSAETGSRTYILAAMTGVEENGKYIKHYGQPIAEHQLYVDIVRVNLHGADSLKPLSESLTNLTSDAGKKLQAQIWKEMLQIFDSVIPEASAIARAKFGHVQKILGV